MVWILFVRSCIGVEWRFVIVGLMLFPCLSRPNHRMSRSEVCFNGDRRTTRRTVDMYVNPVYWCDV